MVSIIQRRKQLRKKAITKVTNWAKKLKLKTTIIIFGSYARGDFNLWSDIDVIIIAETNKPITQRLQDIDYPPQLEIIYLTPQEFQKLLNKKEPYIIEAIQKGIIIRDDYNLTQKTTHTKLKTPATPHTNNPKNPKRINNEKTHNI